MNKIVNGVANDYEFNDIGYYQEINIPARQVGKTYQVINMYEQKYNQLQSNWNSLRELIEKEKTRLAKECSHTYEDSLGKTKYVNEDIFNELNKISDRMNELEGKDKDE